MTKKNKPQPVSLYGNHIKRQDEIFVFGSNEAGIHGAGAALTAHVSYGAELGIGVGMTGDSYAIPTKDRFIQTLPLQHIRFYVEDFLDFAKANPDKKFFVTTIGTGLAGYSHWDIAPLFDGAPANCRLPPEWERLTDRTEK